MSSTSIRSGSINILLLIGLSLPSLGQVIQLDRYELVLEDKVGLSDPTVISLGSEGLVIQRRIIGKKLDQLDLIKLDTALVENWKGIISIEKNLVLSKIATRNQMVFMLFRAAGYGNFDFTIIAMDARTRGYNQYVIKNLIPLNPTNVQISPNAILVGGYFNNLPVVLHYSFATGRSRLLPGFFNEVGELNEIRIYEDGLIDITVSARNMQRKKVLWVRTYTSEGDLLQATTLEGELDKALTFGRSLRKVDGTQIVAGSFGIRNAEYSRGIFVAEIKPGGDKTIHYHNFSDFGNFFKFMKPRREARLTHRINQRKVKGKRNRQSFRFITSELHQYGDHYLLLGEVFYPRYQYANPYGFFGYGPYSGTRGERIFDGYRYTHATVVGFGENGQLKWDNTFEMGDIKTFTLNQFVRLAPKDDRIGLLYFSDNAVHTKTIKYNEVLERKSSSSIKLKFATDMVRERNNEATALEYWYHPYFYAHGIQYVRDSRNGKNEIGRKVLFINKLKFQ